MIIALTQLLLGHAHGVQQALELMEHIGSSKLRREMRVIEASSTKTWLRRGGVGLNRVSER